MKNFRAYSRLRSEQAVANNDVERIIWEGSDYGGTANCFKHYVLYSGEANETEDGLAAAFEAADYIVEGEYHTGAQEQLYIEPNGVIAECEKDDKGDVIRVCVQGSMQCPYYLVHALTLIFKLPEEKCRVIQTETGGAFGGKEDFPSSNGLACRTARDEVRTSGEDGLRPRRRHGGDDQAPSFTHAAPHGGIEGRKAVELEIEIALDGGAYATLSPVVLSRATIHAPGAYKWPFVRVRAKAMATNLPPHGAFRGFGAPRSVCSRSSGTWIRLRGLLGSHPRSCAAATSSLPVIAQRRASC